MKCEWSVICDQCSVNGKMILTTEHLSLNTIHLPFVLWYLLDVLNDI